MGAASGAGRWGPASERRGAGVGAPRQKMTRERFTKLVEDALRDIPYRFREAMKNVAVVVEDEPSPDLLEDLEMEPDDTLFGLYHGTPLTERDSHYGNTLPDRISILSAADRRGVRRRRGHQAVRGRDRHSRVWSLFRFERGRDRGDRREVLAGRLLLEVRPRALHHR